MVVASSASSRRLLSDLLPLHPDLLSLCLRGYDPEPKVKLNHNLVIPLLGFGANASCLRLLVLFGSFVF